VLQLLQAEPPLHQNARFYNYAASAVQLRDRTILFYCANASSGIFEDRIFFRQAEGADGICGELGEQRLALQPSEGAWDSRHVCDPEVVKGRFWLRQREYVVAPLPQFIFVTFRAYTSSACSTPANQKKMVTIAMATRLARPWR
jgi:hypothetical protein